MRKNYDPIFLKEKPDIIHAHTLFSDGSLAYHYYKEKNIPYIITIRSTDIEYFLKYKPWLKKYGKLILNNAGKVIFISPSLRNQFNQIYGTGYDSKSQIVPNGINPLYLSSGEIQKMEIHKPLEMIYVGSFLRRKNVPALIKLVERYPGRLTIIGQGGDEESRVLRMIRNSNKVNYLGRIEDLSRLIEIYRQSDIFIMTSKGETFGLVYIEAMSQGLPIVYSKNTGIDGFFEQGSIGFGVTPGSIYEMKNCLDRIGSDYHKISQKCISESKAFNWTNIAQTYIEIYSGLS